MTGIITSGELAMDGESIACKAEFFACYSTFLVGSEGPWWPEIAHPCVQEHTHYRLGIFAQEEGCHLVSDCFVNAHDVLLVPQIEQVDNENISEVAGKVRAECWLVW